MTIKFDIHIHVHASADEVRSIKDTLAQLVNLEMKTMSAISDFAARQKVFNDRMDAAVEGLTVDVAELNRKIQELQNTSGTITPEDQALLDELEQRGEMIARKLEVLDSLTPPKLDPGA